MLNVTSIFVSLTVASRLQVGQSVAQRDGNVVSVDQKTWFWPVDKYIHWRKISVFGVYLRSHDKGCPEPMYCLEAVRASPHDGLLAEQVPWDIQSSKHRLQCVYVIFMWLCLKKISRSLNQRTHFIINWILLSTWLTENQCWLFSGFYHSYLFVSSLSTDGDKFLSRPLVHLNTGYSMYMYIIFMWLCIEKISRSPNQGIYFK